MDIEKEKVINIAKEAIQENILSLEKSIEKETRDYKDAPTATQSWSDTSRSQIEGRLVELNKQLSKKRSTLDMFANYKKDSIKSRIGLWSLVKVEKEDEEMWFLITPTGGKDILIENYIIQLVSSSSPIAQAFNDRKEGETVNVKTPSGVYVFEIKEVK